MSPLSAYMTYNRSLLLLLLLSRFSHVRLCATPETAAHQASPSLGFSRQEHWSGLPFPSPTHESEKWKRSFQLCPTLCNPMDCSLPGSSIHGIFQARVLEWGALPSPYWKTKKRDLSIKFLESPFSYLMTSLGKMCQAFNKIKNTTHTMTFLFQCK